MVYGQQLYIAIHTGSCTSSFDGLGYVDGLSSALRMRSLATTQASFIERSQSEVGYIQMLDSAHSLASPSYARLFLGLFPTHIDSTAYARVYSKPSKHTSRLLRVNLYNTIVMYTRQCLLGFLINLSMFFETY